MQQNKISETVKEQIEGLKNQHGENLVEVFAHPGRVAGYRVQEGDTRALCGEVDCQELPKVYPE